MEPVKIAFIGAGRRPWQCYYENLTRLSDLFEVVAVCDAREEAARKAADYFAVPHYTSIKQLLADRPMEAAITVTPVPSHYPISVVLSRAGVHHTVETAMATTTRQCRLMSEEARRGGVVLHVNEQFFRRPLLQLARRVIASGAIGEVHRISTFHSHTGYHNNSIFQVFGGGPPRAVNAIYHTMPIARYMSDAGRWHESELFRAHFMHFPSALLVTDVTGNVKNARGRYPRPGYLEIDGTLGAFVEQGVAPWQGRSEVRLVPEERVERGAYADSFAVERLWLDEGGAQQVSTEVDWGGPFERLRVRLPQQTIEFVNPFHERGIVDTYAYSVAEALAEFARVVRGEQEPAFTPEMGTCSRMMDVAFGLSASLDGAQVELPLPDEDTDEEKKALAELQKQYGVDPMDAEAMLEVHLPPNYLTQ